jgi:hypothetical protein
MPADVAAELSRQLCAEARARAGVALDDGMHMLAAPGASFTVEHAIADGRACAYVEADLVGPDATAHPVELAWRSIAGGEPLLALQGAPGTLAFFWRLFPTLPAPQPTLVDAAAVLAPVRFGFEIGWSIRALSGVRMHFVARTAFSIDEIGVLLLAIDAAVADWNRCRPARLDRRTRPQVAGDRSSVTVYLDLGDGGIDALAAVLQAADAAPAGRAVARCDIGWPAAAPHAADPPQRGE